MTNRLAQARKRRWRFYETQAGRRPVKDFLTGLSDPDAAAVAVEMRDVAKEGTEPLAT